MIVNFKNIPCRPSLKSDKIEEYDLSKDLGEVIYTTTTNPEDFELAVKIFNCPDEGVDLTEQEIVNSSNYIGGFPVWVQHGIITVLSTILQANQTQPEPPAVPEHIPGTPAPDGGVWAGDEGVPAPAEVENNDAEPIAEWIEPAVEESIPEVTTKKKSTKKKNK